MTYSLDLYASGFGVLMIDQALGERLEYLLEDYDAKPLTFSVVDDALFIYLPEYFGPIPTVIEVIHPNSGFPDAGETMSLPSGTLVIAEFGDGIDPERPHIGPGTYRPEVVFEDPDGPLRIRINLYLTSGESSHPEDLRHEV